MRIESNHSADVRTPAKHDSPETDLLAIVRDLANELHARHGEFRDLSLSSRLERDLGIDSLGRTELILRIERAFRVRLPPETIGTAETVGDLARALDQAAPKRRLEQAEAPIAPSLPPASAPTQAKTLTEALDWHAAQHPDRLHMTVLQDEAAEIGSLTYSQLAKAARDVAAGLIARDVAPGDRIALMLPTGLDFFIAFFGIIYAGAAPVPIYPPMQLSRLEEHLRRQAGILRNAGARILITTPQASQFAALLGDQVPSLESVESVASLMAEAPSMRLPQITDPSATALVQYTSGSTGDPKGVVLSHANLLANIRAIGEAMAGTSADVFVSWLPLYHDMGLIGAWLACLYFAAPVYAMSPLSFLARPESWLWAMHHRRATLSASPNFGLELCLNKIEDLDIEGLDLSRLRLIANGAEPVSAATLRRFIERFGRYGFRPEAMAPAYGLAENAMGLAFPPLGRPPLVDRVKRDALARHGLAQPAGPDDPNPVEIVSCGQPLPGDEIRIVDEIGREVDDRCEGRVEFRGPSATSGYFRNEAQTRALFHTGWLDSGDRGYMAGGEVYITGRIKDVIIRAGQHIYPQEIEATIGEIPGICKGGVVAFGVADRLSGTERVVVVAETAETDAAARSAARAHANEVTSEIAGAPPDEILFAPPGTTPKTSSGKIRRSAAKDLYERGGIGAAPRALRWQILRLTLAGLGLRLMRSMRLLAELAYGLWCWSVTAPCVLAAWLAVMILPRLAWRWAALRRIAGIPLAAAGIRPSVAGLERLPSSNAILVFNHASYADALVLVSLLPGEPAFVAKKELSRQLFVGPFLRRLGVLFVERFDTEASLTDAATATGAARGGRVLVFFPEGGFTRRAGLSDFYLGAFKAAAETDLPVFPGVLRGTRSILRADQWLPRRAAISVEITSPIYPAGTNFQSALRLRDDARNAILARCGEPDIGELVKPSTPTSVGKDSRS